MSSIIHIKTYNEPPFCEKEILRYSGCKSTDSEISALMQSAIGEVREKLIYKVCYRELQIAVNGDVCDFEHFSVQSKNLADNLKDCFSVIVFSATVGIEIDRLITKYGRISPSKALALQAIGAERIEALCDAFCEDIAKEKNITLKPRFSPGYGDLPLSVQRDIFNILDCSKRIGVFLNDSMLMSPSKSVTAFVGLTNGEVKQKMHKCDSCDKIDCSYRGAL